MQEVAQLRQELNVEKQASAPQLSNHFVRFLVLTMFGFVPQKRPTHPFSAIHPFVVQILPFWFSVTSV